MGADELFRRTDGGDDAAAPQDTAALSAIFAEIIDERIAQDQQWGGPEHDDEHNPIDWLNFVNDRLGDVSPFDYSPEALAHYRRRLVQTAALAVAALQSLDRQAADA